MRGLNFFLGFAGGETGRKKGNRNLGKEKQNYACRACGRKDGGKKKVIRIQDLKKGS